MRKAILLTAAAAFLAVPAVVQAQEGPTDATVAATAVISGFAEFVDDPATGALNFGTVTAGDAAEVTTDGAGAVILPVRHNTSFTLTFSGLDDDLEGTNPGNTLAITYYCDWVEQDGEATVGGTALCVDGQAGGYTGPGVRQGDLRIGGALGDTNVSADTYTGTLTISIAAGDS